MNNILNLSFQSVLGYVVISRNGVIDRVKTMFVCLKCFSGLTKDFDAGTLRSWQNQGLHPYLYDWQDYMNLKSLFENVIRSSIYLKSWPATAPVLHKPNLEGLQSPNAITHICTIKRKSHLKLN